MPTRRLLPAALCLTCLLAQQKGSKNIARTTVGRKVALVMGNRDHCQSSGSAAVTQLGV
jgi:calcineurin-like phosphoesterase family protein